MRIGIQFFLFLTVVILAGIKCNAPRNNPADPLNEDYNFGTIEGTVQTIGTPSFGIDGVNVLWENANLNTETDANGRFRLRNIPIENGNIIFSKSGYKPDTLFVVWGSSKRFITLTFFNSIPTLDTVSFYSIIENAIAQTKASIFIKAWITDPDEDVDTVFIFNEILNLKKPLAFIEGNYQSMILESELGGKDIEETIGLNFSIIAKDKYQNEFNIGNVRITRVITDEVSGLVPTGDSTLTSQNVILNWDEFRVGYDFTYIIEVYFRELTIPILIHSKSDISSDTTSYPLPIALTDGDYYWVIWVVDQFQNRSRSKPVLFKIE